MKSIIVVYMRELTYKHMVIGHLKKHLLGGCKGGAGMEMQCCNTSMRG